MATGVARTPWKGEGDISGALVRWTHENLDPVGDVRCLPPCTPSKVDFRVGSGALPLQKGAAGGQSTRQRPQQLRCAHVGRDFEAARRSPHLAGWPGESAAIAVVVRGLTQFRPGLPVLAETPRAEDVERGYPEDSGHADVSLVGVVLVEAVRKRGDVEAAVAR